MYKLLFTFHSIDPLNFITIDFRCRDQILTSHNLISFNVILLLFILIAIHITVLIPPAKWRIFLTFQVVQFKILILVYSIIRIVSYLIGLSNAFIFEFLENMFSC